MGYETEGQGILQEADREDATYNLASLFTEVGHPESQDIQQGAGIAPVYNLADLFKVEAATEEAGVEEADVAARDILHWPGSVEPFQPSGPVGGFSKLTHRA